MEASRVEALFRHAIVAICMLLMCTGLARGQDADEEDEDPFAQVQSYWSGEYERYTPEVARSEVTFFARMARLTEDQRAAALELHATYAERARAAGAKMQEYERALSRGEDELLYEDEEIQESLKPVREDFHKHQEKIKNELLADMKTVLTDEQRDRWEWFERRTKWDQETWGLGLNGQRPPDLALAVHRTAGNEPVSDEVLAVLSRFYADFAALVADRQEAREARRAREAAEAPADPEGVEGDADEAMPEEEGPEAREGEEFSRRALEIVERAQSKLLGLLPESQREAFEEWSLDAMTDGDFDWWGRMGDPSRQYRKVLALESLSAEQRAQLTEMQVQARKEKITKKRAELSERLKKPLGTHQQDESDADQMKMMMKFQQAAAANKALLSKIRGVLTPDQQKEAGPPIEKPRVRLPNFDDEDEPAPELGDHPRWMGALEQQMDAAAVNDLDLAFLKRAAPLTDDQYAAAKDLFAAYQSRSRNASQKMMAWQRSMSERMMQGETPDFMDKAQIRSYLKYEMYRKRIKNELLAEVRDLLTEEQSAAYDALKKRASRKVLREDEVQGGGLAANVDVVAVAESVFVDEEVPADVRELLARYEEDVSPVVDRLNAFQDQELKRAQKMAEGVGAMDMGDLMGLVNNVQDQAQKHALEARDLNVKCFRELVPRMPEEKRAEFEVAFYSAADFYSRAMSMVGRGGAVSVRGLFDEAKALGDLTPEQEQVMRTALREHVSKSAELLRGSFEQQLAAEKPGEKAWTRMQNLDYESMRKREEAVRESSKQAIARMHEALSEEQRARLPKTYRPPEPVTRPNFDEE